MPEPVKPPAPPAPPKPHAEPAKPHDEAIEGGKYVVNGNLVNAHGERIDESGKVLSRDEIAHADAAK